MGSATLLASLFLVLAVPLRAQPAGTSDSLPVTVLLEASVARVKFNLASASHLLVLDITFPKSVEVLFPDDQPGQLRPGNHELQFDRPPLVNFGGGGFPAPYYGACTEFRPIRGGDGMVSTWTGACGLTPALAVAASRAYEAHGASGATLGTTTSFLIVVTSEALDRRMLRKVVPKGQKAGTPADYVAAFLEAVRPKAAGLRSAMVVVSSK